jgi:hypothetical protein
LSSNYKWIAKVYEKPHVLGGVGSQDVDGISLASLAKLALHWPALLQCSVVSYTADDCYYWLDLHQRPVSIFQHPIDAPLLYFHAELQSMHDNESHTNHHAYRLLVNNN